MERGVKGGLDAVHFDDNKDRIGGMCHEHVKKKLHPEMSRSSRPEYTECVEK